MNHKAQSQIIGTILLILIAVSAAAIIGVFAVNFVRNNLEETNCLDVVDKLEITNSPQYTCYNPSNPANKKMRVQVHLLDADIEGFIIEISKEGSSVAYTIKDGETTNGVGMLDKNIGEPLELPEKNTELTYKIQTADKPAKVTIYPIIESQTCGESDSITEIIDCYP